MTKASTSGFLFTLDRGEFKILSNIYDGVFQQKLLMAFSRQLFLQSSSQMFDRDLNTLLLVINTQRLAYNNLLEIFKIAIVLPAIY